MFVPDKPAAMREAFRVLRSGGLFLFNVWDSFDVNSFAEIAHTTIASFFDRDPPKFYELPFNLQDCTMVRRLLQDAGFDRVEFVAQTKSCQSGSARNFATGLVRGNPVEPELVERGVEPDVVIDAVAKRLARCGGAAPFESTMRAIVWQAIRPERAIESD